MSTVNQVYFHIDESTPLVEDLCSYYKDSNDIEISFHSDSEGCIQQISKIDSGIFIFKVASKMDLQDAVLILKKFETDIKLGLIKPVCLLFESNEKIEKILAKYRCFEVFELEVLAKVLSSKIDLWTKRIQDLFKKQNTAEPDLLGMPVQKEKIENMKKKQSEETEKDPFGDDDPFAEGNEDLIDESYSDMQGAAEAAATMFDGAPSGGLDHMASFKEHMHDTDKEIEPLLVKKMITTVEEKDSVAKILGGDLTQTKLDKKVIPIIPGNASREERIIPGNDSLKEKEEVSLDQIIGQEIDLDLESGELEVVLKQETKSGNILSIICEFEDFYEDELVVKAPLNSLPVNSEVIGIVKLNYNGKQIKVQSKGIIGLVEVIDNKDLLVIQITKIDPKKYEEFLSLYQNRQESIHDFMEQAKGY